MNQDVVDYRWGDKYKAMEFIQRNSYEIEKIIEGFDAGGDELVEKVVAFIRDEFVYPLTGGQPSTDAQFLRFHKSLFDYYWKKCVYYMWSFPVETLALFKAGVCIDTANLATSLLRVKHCKAWTCLGEVRRTSTDDLLGYHAWTSVYYKTKPYLNETTIHQKGANTLVLEAEAYDRTSDSAKRGDIYYIEHGRYNEDKYTGVTDLGKSGIIFTLMGKPFKFLQLYGLEKTLKIKPKKLYKEWKREEIDKQRKIFDAWGG